MKRHIMPFLVASLMLAEPGGLRAQVHPSLATDRPDYSPGSQVAISGSGFKPGERVRLLILQSDLRENGRPEHQPWQVRADRTGAFQATWPVTAHEAGATLWLAVRGMSSRRTAQTIFTDASVVAASGGGAIPASSYAGTYTALTGPVLTETIIGDINVGTIVLTTPAGFVFDTNAPLPVITLAGDNNNKNINNLPNGAVVALAITTNTLSFTITTKSHGQTKNTLTYSNIRVRPIAASPLASGNITNTGSSTFPNSTANFGTLTEVAGSITTLDVSGFPTPQVAGTAASVTVAAHDQFGNTVTGYTGTVHFTSSDPQGVLPADYAYVATDNGTHTFSAVTLRTIGTQSITASNMAAGSFSGAQSGIVVSPAPADRLAFSVQPGAGTYGSLPNPQPVVVSQDVYGNTSTVGLGASKVVTVALTSGSGSLMGTTSLDIGTAAGKGTASFSNLGVNSAGAGKQLTASAAGLTNAVSSSFTISQAVVTANVTVNNKIYDTTTTAAIATRSLTGVLGTDNVTLVGGAAAFVTKSVGNGNPVNVTGLGLGGTAAGNYALASTTVTTSANITPVGLAVTGVSANNRVYDGTTAATLAGTPSLTGVLGGDSVSVSGTPSATFANKLVGNNKPVTVTGYTASGTDAGNYTLSQPTGLTANITAAGLTVSGITANNRMYDGGTTATLSTSGAALNGVAAGDTVTLSTAGATGAFATKTVGTAKTVTVSGLTVSGADVANYTLAQPTTSANITASGLTVSGITANNKSYDATTSATLNVSAAALVGVLGSDSVSLNTGNATGVFATKDVGAGKTVGVSGLTLGATDAGNYTLTQPTTTANITAAGLTVSGITANNKVYDASSSATLNTAAGALVGVLGSDAVSLNTGNATGMFATKTVGVGKTVSVSGLTVSGADAGNYTLTQPSATASITAAGLTVSGVTANNKVYDATTSATLNTSGAVLVGVLGGDSVNLNTFNATGSFATKTVGTAKAVTISGLTVSGGDSGNYAITQPSTSADITAAGLTVSALTANGRVYDGTTSATLNTSGASLTGVQGSDAVTLNTTGAAGSFATKTVGTGKTVTVSGLTLSGTDAGNYTLTQPTASANISSAPLTVSAVAADKVYDGSTAASVNLSDNRVAGDSLSDSCATAAFSDKNVGNGKTVNVTGISVTGADASNYTANVVATASAAITPASLTGTAADQARRYGQANPAFTVGYSGFVGDDTAGILTGTLSVGTSANTNSPVGAYAITASGQSAANYTIQYVGGTLTVNPAHLCAAANDATRLYGHPNPSFTASINGFVNGEDTNVLSGALTLNTTAQTNSLPGNYPIVPSGLLSANYSIAYSNGTLAVTSTNQGPVLAAISDATVRPDDLLMFQVSGSDPDGDQITFSLDSTAPTGAIVTNVVTRITHPGSNPTFVTNTVFVWVPTRAQATSTNRITLHVTDNGGPPMSAAQTFTVVVLDYVEVTIGSTNVQSGDSVAVPIRLASSDGVTNLTFNLPWPADYLSNAVLTVTAPEVGTASLQDQGTNLVLTLQAAPGQLLQGTQEVAQLSFVAISNQFSAFVPLQSANASAVKPDGSSYVNYLAPVARVVVIEGEPLLLASLSSNLSRELNLYGRLGRSYELQSATSLASPIVWTPQWDYVQTNGVITISVDSAPPMVFYRIYQPFQP